MGIWTRKDLSELATVAAEVEGKGGMRRVLSRFDLVLIGVGSTVGAGIFVITGTAAAQYAGPAIVLSFIIAGLACLSTGFCYAELASMMPVAGSSYTYAYATLGELVAWTIGTPWQRQGYAAEAAAGLVIWLVGRGIESVVAHVHADHQASAAVASRAGLQPTDAVVDGEVVWRRG